MKKCATFPPAGLQLRQLIGDESVRFYHSPYLRTRQTLLAILEVRGCPRIRCVVVTADGAKGCVSASMEGSALAVGGVAARARYDWCLFRYAWRAWTRGTLCGSAPRSSVDDGGRRARGRGPAPLARRRRSRFPSDPHATDPRARGLSRSRARPRARLARRSRSRAPLARLHSRARARPRSAHATRSRARAARATSPSRAARPLDVTHALGAREAFAGLRVGVASEPRLREQDFGNFQDAEAMKQVFTDRQKFGRFYYRFPNGEAGTDVYDRVSGLLSSLFLQAHSKDAQQRAPAPRRALCFLCIEADHFHQTKPGRPEENDSRIERQLNPNPNDRKSERLPHRNAKSAQTGET